MLKDFVDEKFEEQKEFIDGKFEEQEIFIQNQFAVQEEYIDGRLNETAELLVEAINESNDLQIALYEAQEANLLSVKEEIVDEFNRLSLDFNSTVEDLKDFYLDIKVTLSSIVEFQKKA